MENDERVFSVPAPKSKGSLAVNGSILSVIEGGSGLAARKERAPLFLVPERELPLVLIADADERSAVALCSAFSGEFELLRADDGEQALRLALIEQPDLVIIDANLPKLDGYRVTRQIKRNPATSEVPVFLLGTDPERIDVLRGFAAGASDYFNKPLNPISLLGRIREALDMTVLIS